MKQCKVRMFAAVCCLLVLCVPYCRAAEPSVEKRTGDAALGELRVVNHGSLSSTDRVDRLVALLRREITEPSAPVLGIGGGPIDSGYVQEVILGSVRTYVQQGANRESLRNCVASKLASLASSDKPMADRLTVMLGNVGDRSVVPALINVMENHEDGFMRYAAARALGGIGDRSSIPALKRCLETDTFARVRLGSSIRNLTPREMVYSPVRLAAAEALRSMGEIVPVGAEIVDARYLVPRLEQLFCTSEPPFRALMMMGNLACPEAEDAIQRYIDAKQAVGASSGLVDYAKDTLARSRVVRSKTTE
ncbi:MAG: HEAT repeat domain-containing protein [Armatimonadota bacterium]|nr:HEAT repeat domain-containing protein [Armatimonadota bacterium]